MGLATTTQSGSTKQLSDLNSTGTVLGYATSFGDRISFFGATPLTRQAGPLATSTLSVSSVQATSISPAASTPTGANTVWGYSSAQQANAIVTAVNQLVTDVTALQGNYAGLRTALITTGLFGGA